MSVRKTSFYFCMAILFAIAGAFPYSASAQVQKVQQIVKIEKDTLRMYVGQEDSLRAYAYPSARVFYWDNRVSIPVVASIAPPHSTNPYDSVYIVKAWKPGKTVIVVRVNEVAARCIVVVTPKIYVDSLRLKRDTIRLRTGDTASVMARIFPYMARRGSVQGKAVAWVGDANNMSYTWVQAARLLDFQVHISTPPGYALDDARISDAERKHLRYFEDPREACRGADLVTTDVWTSMGYEAENEARAAAFANFCVDEQMMALANPDAVFMHCLPAHRGEEVTAGVIDGPQSVVWDEAENRLHVQKALLEYLVIGRVPT